MRGTSKPLQVCYLAQATDIYTPLFPNVLLSIAASIIRFPLMIEVVQMIISFRAKWRDSG